MTFYLSRVLGKTVFSINGEPIGKLKDLLLDLSEKHPKVVAAQIRIGKQNHLIDYSGIEIFKGDEFGVRCRDVKEFDATAVPNYLYLVETVLDKQIVDINGRKLVRVNDIRMAIVPSGTFAVAVDVGIEGLLRRIGLSRKTIKYIERFNIHIPSKFILWDDVEAIDSSKHNIKLSQPYSKLHTLHPSDLADIMEDLDKPTRTSVFAALDEEKAADVLEELEPHAQVHIIESLTTEKAADVLEKMPADEVADILDELTDEKAEELLNEMEKESSDDVRELMEYPPKTVGSIMTTDFLTFSEDLTAEETIHVLRKLKPESDEIYSLFIVNQQEELIAAVSLRDLVVSEPDKKLSEMMTRSIITVYDDDEMDSLAEMIEKYDMLAIPVISRDQKMQGVVVIDDIVEGLLKKVKTKI